jgi:hypothetical protein
MLTVHPIRKGKMKDLVKRRPSPALVISILALIVALSGTAYAALGKNSVKSKQIAKGAVKTSELAKNAVSTAKIKNAAVTANKIAAGVIPATPAVAYARVSGPGVVTNSKGIVSMSHVSPFAPYCFDLSFSPQNGVANAAAEAAGGSTAAMQIPPSVVCPAGSDASVLTRDGSNMANEQPFFVLFTS